MAPRPVAGAAAVPRLEALLTAWLAGKRSANTRAAYRADLDRFVVWCADRGADPLGLDRSDLLRYRRGCEDDGAAPATVARRLSAITSFVGFATTQDAARSSTAVARPTVSTRTTTGLLTRAEARALVAAADRTGTREAALIRLFLFDGLKVGEAIGANANDVAGRPPTMTLTLNTRRQPSVELHPETARAIRAYLGGRRHGPLLLSEGQVRRSDRLTRFGVGYIVNEAAAAAGVRAKLSSNTLRRRFIVDAHERGVDLNEIRRSSGHVDQRTTRRYLAPDDDPGSSPR